MINTIQINGEWLPEPSGDLSYNPEKIKTENETEAGTTMVIVTRPTKFSVSGSWKLSGKWIRKFRSYREADTVAVSAYYPDPFTLSTHECQFEMKEKELTKARGQYDRFGGFYEVDVEITEL